MPTHTEPRRDVRRFRCSETTDNLDQDDERDIPDRTDPRAGYAAIAKAIPECRCTASRSSASRADVTGIAIAGG
jgi:hypothetical protein